MNLEKLKVRYRPRNIALKSSSTVCESSSFFVLVTQISDDLELLDESSPSLALLINKFNSLIISLRKRKDGLKPRRLFSSSTSGTSSSSNSSKGSEQPVYEQKNIDTVRCGGCRGIGHISRECLTLLRKKRENYIATLSDDQSGNYDEPEEPVMLFVSVDMELDEERLVDFDASFENEYDDLDVEDNDEVSKPDTTQISVGETCETNMYVSHTTTNWYEITVIDELNPCSTNPSDTGKNT